MRNRTEPWVVVLWPLLACVAAVVMAGCSAAPVRDTGIYVALNDQQRLVGDMTTASLTLKTALGDLAFDPAVVGELGPVEGKDLGQSGAAVTLWLRDGSEYTGVWTNPDAAVSVVIGGTTSNVTLPIDRLERLQFTGSEIWPKRRVVRVITTTGDDFLVVGEETRITIVSALGTFSPTLDEVAAIRPPAEGEEAWRVELMVGTVLIGRLQSDALIVVPSLGPERVTVPLEKLKLVHQEKWNPADFGVDWRGLGGPQRESKYFDNDRFRQQKQQLQRQN
ncbi:MAG: hypothetical protein AB7K09_09255 [Planctomycetota bacterium]